MALTHSVTPREVGQLLVEAVKHEPALEHLFVSTNRDEIELWLLTAVTDAPTERRLYEHSLMLYDRFPDMGFRVGVLNPAYFEDRDVRSLVPPDAEEIPLRPC